MTGRASPSRLHGPAGRRQIYSAHLSRREFLGASALALLGESSAAPEPQPVGRDLNRILIWLTGGPGQLDTWDMKPDAPREFRGPFRPVRTNVPGIDICEIFPRMARHADRFSIVRSVHIPGPEARGQDRWRRLFDPGGQECPRSERYEWHGIGRLQMRQDRAAEASTRLQTALDLDQERLSVRERYGSNRFGRSCLLARRLVERGAKRVTIRMFEADPQETTWDAHGVAPFPGLAAYRDHCGPCFDNGYSSLVEDLIAAGLYQTTQVVALGGHGRSPRLNAHGGRDHWPHCWSMILGGGGLRGGMVVGASDAIGAYPSERPVTPEDVFATLCCAPLVPASSGASTPWPIQELL